MRKNAVIRFAVGTPNGPHSGQFRIWTTNNEVYIADRVLGGEYKISLHSDDGNSDDRGHWRESFTSNYWSELGERNSFRDSRHVRDILPGFWIKPGIRVAFIIQVHVSELREFTISAKHLKNLKWVDAPSNPNNVSRFFIAFVDADVDDVVQQGEDAQLLLDHQLPNSKRVVVVYVKIRDEGNYKNWIAEFTDQMKISRPDVMNSDFSQRKDFSSLRICASTTMLDDQVSAWVDIAYDTVFGNQSPPWDITL